MNRIEQPWSVIFISLLTALSAYVILFFVSGYSSLYFAYDFDIQAYMSMEGVVYQTPLNDAHWTFDALMTILISKPLASFFLGLLSLVLLLVIKKKSVTWLYFLIWMSLWGINGAMGLLVEDAIFGMGTYEVARAMNFSLPVVIVIGTLSAYFLFLVGKLLCRLYLVHLAQAPFYTDKHRNPLIFTTIVLPWLVVLVINYSNWFPSFSLYELFKNFTLVILFIPFFFSKDHPLEMTFKRNWNQPVKIDLLYLLGLFLIATLAISLLVNGFSIPYW